MGKYIIRGGRKLSGVVNIESAKNSVLPIMAASIISSGIVVIKKCPKISDVFNMIKILNSLGVKTFFYENDLVINPSCIDSYTVCYDLANKLRSSFFMVGALISRLGKASVSYPGGCKIGKRPVDIHLQCLKDVGIYIDSTPELIFCSRLNNCGGETLLPYPSVGATENLILASVISKGQTIIKNAAKEPEIIDLAGFLNSMGAKIYGAGSDTIFIEGVYKLYGSEYTPIPDRIEAGTYILAAAITGGEIELSNCKPENISILLNKICNNTCNISISNDIIYLKSGKIREPFSIVTGPYPEFPTDLQPQALAYGCVSDGVFCVKETVFENRFGHVRYLNKMGAEIKVFGNTAICNGVKGLVGCEVFAEDLRGGAALTIAGLCAEGKTVVNNVEYIERGYTSFDLKLKSLGADIVYK